MLLYAKKYVDSEVWILQLKCCEGRCSAISGLFCDSWSEDF